MKRAINSLLFVGTIIFFCISIKLSNLPYPFYMPNRWAEFWITSVEAQQQYVLLYDFSIGFVLSALFYFIVEELPAKFRVHKAKRLIGVYVNQLIEHMEQLISIVLAKYERNQNLNELSQKDFLLLDGELKISAEEISFQTTTFYVRHRKRKTAVHSYGTVNKIVKENLKQIIDNISAIKNYEYFYASDDLLVECIRKIESCKLIKYYSDDSKTDIPCFQLYGTSKAMSEFIELYLRLLKRKFHTEYTKTILDNEEETIKYRNDRNTGAFFQTLFDCQTKQKNIAAANPTAIISGSKYTTDILITQLKQRLIATFFSINNIDLEKLDKFKYAVFVSDSDSKNTLIRFLTENTISPQILLLSEKNILKRGIKNKIICGNNVVIDEIFFRSSFKLPYFPIVFNKHEPSEEKIGNISSQIKSILYKKYE